MLVKDEYTKVAALMQIKGLDLGKTWEVNFKEKRPRRSNNQNALMWKWINEVADHVSAFTGYTDTQIHNHCKRSFLKPTQTEVFGRKQVAYTTTNLDTAEMTAYMNKIHEWATQDVGIAVSMPEDLHAHS